MKTKAQSWLTVLLSVAASTFICESVQAQFNFQPARDAAARDRAYRNSWNGGGNGNSAPSGPSPAQIAQQQRQAAATAQNNQGLEAYKKKDWAAAAAYFQQALQNTPNDPVIIKNLAGAQNWEGVDAFNKGDYTTALNYVQQALTKDPNNAQFLKNLDTVQGKLAEAKREQEQRQQDKVTANNLQTSIQSMTQKLTGTPASGGLDFNDGQSSAPAASGKGNDSGGLDFIDSSAQLKDAVAGSSPSQQKQQQPSVSTSDQKVSTGTFGEKVARFNEPSVRPLAEGTDIKAGDQSRNVAFNSLHARSDSSKEQASNDSSKGFDQGGGKGQADVVVVSTPAGSPAIPEIPQDMRGNKLIQQDVEHLKDWTQQLKQANEDIQTAQKTADQAKTPQDKAAALTTLILAQGKSDGLQVAIGSAKKDIEQQVIHFKSFTVSSASPSFQSPSAVPAAGTPTATKGTAASTQSGN